MFRIMDSTKPVRWWLSINLSLLSQVPEWLRGISGLSAAPFPHKLAFYEVRMTG